MSYNALSVVGDSLEVLGRAPANVDGTRNGISEGRVTSDSNAGSKMRFSVGEGHPNIGHTFTSVCVTGYARRAASPSRFVIRVVTLAIAASSVLAQPVHADETPAGRIVIASTGTDAVILWDASLQVGNIVNKKTPRDQAMHDLEAQSLSVMASKLGSISKSKTVTVRIVYAQTGSANPNYGATTFESYTPVATVTVRADRIRERRAALSSDLRAGKASNDVTVTETGSLPPS